jgi:hypothetical protein
MRYALVSLADKSMHSHAATRYARHAGGPTFLKPCPVPAYVAVEATSDAQLAPSCSLENAPHTCTDVHLKCGQDLRGACRDEEIDAIQAAAYPVSDRIDSQTLDS